MDIGYKLRNLRRIKNFTQEELADVRICQRVYLSD